MKAATQKILDQCNKQLIGKEDKVILALCALYSGGHVLIEDQPGVGKTTLVKTLGEIFDFNLSRIQFTNDILPSDIVGSNIFNKESNSFEFHRGPIFGGLILADELNRAPAKTQSALLQAMEEKKVTVDRKTYPLSNLFTVFATQNPNSQVGTFDLPESQLDRFCMKFNLGFSDKESTMKMLKEKTSQSSKIECLVSTDELTRIQENVKEVTLQQPVYEYVYSLLEFTRNSQDYLSLSNRCGLDLIKTAKAYAYNKDRDYVLPDDIQFLFPFVAGHRLLKSQNSTIKTERESSLEVLDSVSLR